MKARNIAIGLGLGTFGVIALSNLSNHSNMAREDLVRPSQEQGSYHGLSIPEDGSVSMTYEGTLPQYGYTKIILDSRKRPSPNHIVWIESDILSKTEYGFQRHAIVDELGDGIFDSGTYPFRLTGTDVTMSRTVSRSDLDNSDFLRLEEIVLTALNSRGTYLKQISQ